VQRVKAFAAAEGNQVVVVSAQVEAELCGLAEEERAEFLAELGVEDPSKVTKFCFPSILCFSPWSLFEKDSTTTLGVNLRTCVCVGQRFRS
jgi:hypothetical protein